MLASRTPLKESDASRGVREARGVDAHFYAERHRDKDVCALRYIEVR